MGPETAFEGVIDLIACEAFYFEGGKGEDVRPRADSRRVCREAAEAARHDMLETLSLYSDELMMALLEEQRSPRRADSRRSFASDAWHSRSRRCLMGDCLQEQGCAGSCSTPSCDYLPSPLDREMTATDIQPAEIGRHRAIGCEGAAVRSR